MRRVSLILVGVVLAAGAVTVARWLESGVSDTRGVSTPAPTTSVVAAARPRVSVRLGGPPIGCFDWGFVRAAPSRDPQPLSQTADVIRAAQVTAMTVCQRGYHPEQEDPGSVHAYPITDPAQAALIIAAVNEPREGSTDEVCAGVGYEGDDQVLVRYGSAGVDRVLFGYGSCGAALASSFAARTGVSIRPHMLDALVPIADTPPTPLAKTALPCPLHAPAAGRGTSQRAPFVARATYSVSICRYDPKADQLQQQIVLHRDRFAALETWLGGLPPRVRGADCVPTIATIHDALLVIDRHRDAYSIDLRYGECGAADSIWASRSGATRAAFERVLAGAP